MSFKQTELGLIPDHWEYKIVSDLIAEKVLDKPLDGNHGGIHPTQKDFVEKGIPFVMASDIVDGMLDYSDCKYISLDKSKELKKGFAKEGDVLLTHKATIGRVAIVGKIDTPYIVLTPQVTYYRVLNNKKIYNQFLKYYFSWNKFNELFLAWAQGGSTRAYLGITAQQKLPIIIPPLEEQKSIAKILSDLDKKIETNNKINKKLEEMSQAIFKQWFVDFEFPNEDGKPYKSSGGEMVESEMGMIPKGWEVISLDKLMDYQGGSQPPSSEFKESFEQGYIRLVQIRDYDCDNHITYIPITSKLKLCNKYDIMLARYGAALGRVMFGLDGAYNVAIAKIIPKDPIYREWLRCYLNTDFFYRTLNNKGQRSAQAGFNQSDISSFKITFPVITDGIIDSFDKITSSIFEERLIKKAENNNLVKLRDTLLPKLMSGEIIVPLNNEEN